jgi:hypothetical protein
MPVPIAKCRLQVAARVVMTKRSLTAGFSTLCRRRSHVNMSCLSNPARGTVQFYRPFYLVDSEMELMYPHWTDAIIPGKGPRIRVIRAVKKVASAPRSGRQNSRLRTTIVTHADSERPIRRLSILIARASKSLSVIGEPLRENSSTNVLYVTNPGVSKRFCRQFC